MKYKACDTLLNMIARCRKEEKILIVTDPESLEVATALWEDASEFPNRSMAMMPPQTTHGQEPPAIVRAAMMEADVTMIPQTWVTLTDEQDIKMINRTLDLLDDDDDVQNVYHNWDEG